MRGTFDGPTVAQAIRATFEHRQTALLATPVALTPAFAERSDKQAQWRAFIRRLDGGRDDDPAGEGPPILADAVLAIAAFLSPVTSALLAGQPFEQQSITITRDTLRTASPLLCGILCASLIS
jgi:hypothetical protein